VTWAGSSTNKTDCHDITEILLKMALNTHLTQQYTHLLLNLLKVGHEVCTEIQYASYRKQTLENTEGAIKNGQSKENGNVSRTRQRKTKQKTQHKQRKQDVSPPTNNWK
jgi:hypothetical protein